MNREPSSAGNVRAWLIVAAVVALLAAVMLPRHTTGSRRATGELEHFEGRIVSGEGTHDPLQSDLYVRANRALEAGDAAAAEAIYREVVAKYPGEAESHEALGACLFFQERHDEARAAYRKALALFPRSAGALYGLGCTAFKQDRHEEARDFLTKALEVDPGDANSHRVLGFVFEQQGDAAGATKHLERAIELDPSLGAELRPRLQKPGA